MRRSRDFALLWAADGVNQFATAVQVTVLPLIAATTLAAGELEMGLLTACGLAGFLLVGLPAGAWTDRLRRRPVMVAANLARTALLAAVPLLALGGALSIPLLAAITLLTGVAGVFFGVAAPSLLPVIVGREHIVAANSRIHTTQPVGRLAGPVVGGALAQLAGVVDALVAGVLAYLGSALLVNRIRTPEPPVSRGPSPNLRAEIREGLSFVTGHRLLRAICAFGVAWNFFFNVGFALHVLLLVDRLDLPAAAVGLLVAVHGVGGVAGAAVAARWIGRSGLLPVAVLSAVVGAPGVALIAMTGPGWRLGLFVLGQLVVGFGSAAHNVAQLSCRQSECPDRLLGRVNASIRFLSWGALPLGALTGGVLGRLLGVDGALWVSAAGCAAAVVLLRPLGRHASRMATTP